MLHRRRPALAASALAALSVLCALVVPTSADAAVRRGSARSYALSYTNAPRTVVRWNPCQTIRYRVNLRHAPPGALRDVQVALARVSAATGLRYRYAGTTRFVATSASVRSVSGTSPTLVIAWAPAGRGPGRSDLLGGAAGVGGWVARSWSVGGVRHRPRILFGYVVVNTVYNRSLPGGFANRPGGTRGELLMHELAHTAGLSHTSDRSQIMYPVLGSHATWGAGDSAGLHRVGRVAGCIS